MRTTDSSTVSQSRAAAGHGCAVVIESPRFGLRTANLCSGGRPLSVTLHAAWDASHFAAAEIEAMVGELADWARSNRSDPAMRIADDTLTNLS
ncbi:hypothetical protein AB0H34_35380 [Saccharopolyspora shandongensis]|uniref:hypothetical protein n=1 Tax=Saccharopolyspora shandongensis TaxID=418495 RepID=UPI0033C33AEA